MRPSRRLDDERLVSERVTGRRHDADPRHDLVVAGGLDIIDARTVDPIEDGVVGRVGEVPLGGLDMDRDAGELGVLAGVVHVQVAVHDGRDVLDGDPGFGQHVRQRAERTVW